MNSAENFIRQVLLALRDFSRSLDEFAFVILITILCAALALPQPIFVAFAIYFWRTERPCQWNERVRDPDYDPRCLY